MAQASHNLLGVVKRKRRLSQERQPLRVGHIELIDFFDAAYYQCPIRRFTRCTNDLLMVAVTDQNNGATLTGELERLQVNLGDKRACSVDDTQLSLLRFGTNPRGNPMGAENQYRAGRNLINRFYENCPPPAQLVDHVPVVDNFVMDVNRAPVGLEREFDNIDGANHPGAKPSGADAH